MSAVKFKEAASKSSSEKQAGIEYSNTDDKKQSIELWFGQSELKLEVYSARTFNYDQSCGPPVSIDLINNGILNDGFFDIIYSNMKKKSKEKHAHIVCTIPVGDKPTNERNELVNYILVDLSMSIESETLNQAIVAGPFQGILLHFDQISKDYR